ncbi:MAG: tRNA (guanosine(46)-N7)-methyltransferase TrmB [Gammaproteobacteria bacterium]|jgi:tRNA (guanine-N7-)-methyltransferase
MKQYRIRSFTLREGRFTKAQREAIKQLFPIYGLALDDGKLDFQQIFGRAAETILEIGFGMGDTLVAMAEQNPQKNFIGIEVFRPGIGSILQQIHAKQLKNIRIIHYDAVEVLQNYIADNSLAGVQIFFPDPWPKRRHHKRRLIQVEFIKLIQQKLKSQGFLHIATDWEDYAKHVKKIFESFSGWIEKNVKSSDRPITKFEQRGKKLQHQIWDMAFVRRPNSLEPESTS